jgi:transposase
MKKDDTRKLDHQSLEPMRAAWRVQGGESPAIVARVVGVDRSTVYGWLVQCRRCGWNGVNAKPLILTFAEARWQKDAMGL